MQHIHYHYFSGYSWASSHIPYFKYLHFDTAALVVALSSQTIDWLFGVLRTFQQFVSYITACRGYVTSTTGPFILTPASLWYDPARDRTHVLQYLTEADAILTINLERLCGNIIQPFMKSFLYDSNGDRSWFSHYNHCISELVWVP